MNIDVLISICIGIGLAASTGFRVFLPLFLLSIASYFHFISLTDSLSWLGNPISVVVFGIAMLVEIVAYYIPFVDNLLDTMAVPLATIAGFLVMFATSVHLDPTLATIVSLIAGSGTAAAIQSFTTVTRLGSSVKTGGLANPIVTTTETGSALALSSLSIFLPIVAGVVVVILLFVLVFFYKYLKSKLS